MADAEDVRRLALALPHVEEIDSDGFDFRVAGQGFVWSYPERRPGKPRLIRTDIAVLYVGDEAEKQALLLGEPGAFFTTPGYDGWPLVMLRLTEVDVGRLSELVTDAWRMRAPAALASELDEADGMHFQHCGEIWRDFPELVPGVLFAEGVTSDVSVDSRVARFTAVASSRLAEGPEGELPEIRAWRRAFARMGLKPTQYRCASESLLRRFRKEGTLPRLHPLVDVCNAASLAFAIPVAVFDVSKVTSYLEVRYAGGDEEYLTFSGQLEHPHPREVIFADLAGQVHARRWTNRQSGLSAVQAPTVAALIVAEALHDSAPSDVPQLMAAIADALADIWAITPTATVLSRASPRFTFGQQPRLP